MFRNHLKNFKFSLLINNACLFDVFCYIDLSGFNKFMNTLEKIFNNKSIILSELAAYLI